ncbi:hypothetical protein BDY24DRAFT_405502 [Mrakia frigida]|uniref:uncharacterized protein n=1 Tax=Mrakia frigida TaxID=29902 RepID=UPI003FCC018C
MIRLMGLPKSMGQAASRNAKFPTKSTVGPLKENGEQLQLLALGKLHSRLYLETNLASGYMTYNVKMDVAGLARTEGKDSLTKFKTWCEEKSGNPLVRFTDGNVDTLTFQKKYSEYTSLELLEQKFFPNVYDASEVDKLGDAPKLTDYSLLEKDAVAAVSFVPRFYVREGHEGVMLSLVAIFYLGKDVTSGASYEHTPRAVTSFDD